MRDREKKVMSFEVEKYIRRKKDSHELEFMRNG